jgi:hypothetical protein
MQLKEIWSSVRVWNSCIRCKIVRFTTTVPFHILTSKNGVYKSYILGLILSSFLVSLVEKHKFGPE